MGKCISWRQEYPTLESLLLVTGTTSIIGRYTRKYNIVHDVEPDSDDHHHPEQYYYQLQKYLLRQQWPGTICSENRLFQ